MALGSRTQRRSASAGSARPGHVLPCRRLRVDASSRSHSRECVPYVLGWAVRRVSHGARVCLRGLHLVVLLRAVLHGLHGLRCLLLLRSQRSVHATALHVCAGAEPSIATPQHSQAALVIMSHGTSTLHRTPCLQVRDATPHGAVSGCADRLHWYAALKREAHKTLRTGDHVASREAWHEERGHGVLRPYFPQPPMLSTWQRKLYGLDAYDPSDCVETLRLPSQE